MYEVYDIWPEIASKSFESDLDSLNLKNVEHIVFAGMGGSGAIGDIFSSILSQSKIHVNIVKGYVLPKTVNSNTLVVATSVSGNTAETISILEDAKKIDSKIIAFSSGGKIQKYCIEKKIQFRNIPMYHSPRASFTCYLFSMLKVLQSSLDIKQKDILDSILELEKSSNKINSTNLTKSNPSLDLAKWIKSIPIIYYPFGLQAAATRFKNSLQENTKMHVFFEDVIETSHNGIMSWERSSIVQPILIQGKNDHIKTIERWKILEEFFQKNNIEYRKIISSKGSILSKLINLIYLLDYTTIYKSILEGIDPSPVKSIEFIKSKLI